MSVLYRPVLIESVEQADALPVGTIIRYLLAPTVLISDEERVWVDGEDTVMTGADLYAARDVWAVLVPIEAEEEWALIYDGEDPTPCADEADAREWARIDGEGHAPSRRYTTHWEETP